MADNVAISSAAVFNAATDDDGSGNHVQIVKLAQSADGSRAPITADANGLKVATPQPSASTGAVAAFTSTSSATIFSANTDAKMRTFANDSDVTLYLMLRAAAASTTAYHARVAPGGFFTTDYTGEVRGILSAAIGTGQVNVGEFT